MLKLSLATTGLAAAASTAHAQQSCASDGTPAQFLPKKAVDPKAWENDVEKLPNCPCCGMGRRQHHHSRMLIQYSDDLPDGVCSLHCAAISLAVNVDREPKTIWVADNASIAEIKPPLEVDQATFLVGSQIKDVMTKGSKIAYSSEAAAKAVMTFYHWLLITLGVLMLLSGGASAAPPDKPPKPGDRDLCRDCGMLAAKYPNWTAIVVYQDGYANLLDGAKDLFKCLGNLPKYAPGHKAADIAGI